MALNRKTPISILGMLRWERKSEPSKREVRVPWPPQFSKYAFPTVLLGAYPLIFLATLVPAALAAFGFYLTGMLLAYQMLRTMLLALVVIVGGGLAYRWRSVHRRRQLAESTDEEDETSELEAATRQTYQLLWFSIIAVLAAGLFSIWSDALPMLQLLKRMQILPRVQMLETVEDTAATVLETTAEVTEPPAQAGGASAVEPDGTIHDPSTTASTTPEEASLTLWILLEAILAGVVAGVLVKNLPGVIGILLQRRTTLDIGARFTYSTLVRYTLSIIGAIVVFGLLGIGWSKV